MPAVFHPNGTYISENSKVLKVRTQPFFPASTEQFKCKISQCEAPGAVAHNSGCVSFYGLLLNVFSTGKTSHTGQISSRALLQRQWPLQ
ncbi:hypothetical protein F7725_024534 [Dissostichus mawsoni]|uniref:Uncharacterized protein n=1 Tax=Dissostichus mawsoni TaxID=36200 RepID=A0A7J5Y0J4_DISMA|nr:hypothetical protein F7725_024534 [Dissostichus mawsoni]